MDLMARSGGLWGLRLAARGTAAALGRRAAAVGAAALLCLLPWAAGLQAAAPAAPAIQPWTELAAARGQGVGAHAARRLQLDRAALEQALPGLRQGVRSLALPLPEGGFSSFALEDSGTLPPGLAARYAQIASLRGADGAGRRLRLDLSPAGVHALVFDEGSTWILEPEQRGGDSYRVFDRALAGGAPAFECAVHDHAHAQAPVPSAAPAAGAPHGDAAPVRYEYRVAIATTGEYTAFHGGTVAGGLAAVVVALNRVNGIYESDLGVHMTLVEDNDLVIYTNAGTDPYSNGSGGAMLGQNQANLDAVIGSANYDVGHVFSTGGGGVASLAVVCSSGSKARGVTGQSAPVGDVFYVDYVAHEMGHQFGANHTFNGSSGSCNGNRAGSSAYEPGSASTIMGYAGICGAQDLQPNSDPYFHARSIEEIAPRLPNWHCAVQAEQANQAPQLAAPAPRTIPARTPFLLEAQGNDPDGDLLRYVWEQYDRGLSAQGSAQPLPTATSGPIVRSFLPTLDTQRSVPRLATLLGAPPAHSEVLPETTRALNFRVTVRDDAAGAGATAHANLALAVHDTGSAFALQEPDAMQAWTCGNTAQVQWEVAGTDLAPIHCEAVDLELSGDGGVQFGLQLATGVPNTGSAQILVPALESTTARLRARCSDNIFFAISPADFTVTVPAAPEAHDDALDAVLEDAGQLAIPFAALLDNDSGGAPLSLVTVHSASGGDALLGDGVVLFTPAADFNGAAGFSYSVQDQCARLAPAPSLATVAVPVLPVNDPPSFALAGDVRILASAGPQQVAGFAGSFVAGPPDESGQALLEWLLEPLADPDGVLASASVDGTGTLQIVPSGAIGAAQLQLRVRDDGGTDAGGTDASAPVVFAIEVLGEAIFSDGLESS